MEIDQLLFDVKESQRIEHIEPDQDSQLFKLHMEAIKKAREYVSKGEIPDVKHIHRILTASTLTSAGRYRYEPVFIAGSERTFPKPANVPALMEEWHRHCQEFQNCKPKSELSITLYYFFLCIHPFEDGNGRVGRIMYNSLRLLRGLPWHTIIFEEHSSYLEALQSVENSIFRPTHIWAY